MSNLTAAYVRSLLNYDPATGSFRWKHRANTRSGWNEQFAGKAAGSVGGTGHLKISINDRSYLAHRLAWLIETGEWPEAEIDHKDGDPGNNRWENLRAATRQQNQCNRRRHKSNRSGFKGISKNASGSTWAAAVYQFGKKIHVGNFATAEAAHDAYCAAAARLYGEFARLA